MWLRYKDRNADSDVENDDEGTMSKTKGRSSKKKRQKRKSAKTKNEKKKKIKAAAAFLGEAAPVKYEAGKFQEARKTFLKNARENGHDFKTACEMWNSSAAKWDLLKGLSRSELVRRRFLPPENPRPRK